MENNQTTPSEKNEKVEVTKTVEPIEPTKTEDTVNPTVTAAPLTSTTPTTGDSSANAKILAAFFVGMMLSAGLILGIQAANKEKTDTSADTPRTSSPATSNESASVSEEELSKYVDAKDCTTVDPYKDLTIYGTARPMISLSLNKSELALGSDGSVGYSRWDTLPVAVDNSCATIKLSDFKVGDTLRVYSEPSSPYGSDKTKVIQLVQKK